MLPGEPKPQHRWTVLLRQSEDKTIVLARRRTGLRNIGWFRRDGSHSPGLDAALKRMQAHQTRIEIEVDPRYLLEKTLLLPLAAVDNLREVVRYELERVTPFRREDVFFDVRVNSRAVKEGSASIDLRLVQRKAIESEMQYLRHWGFDLNIDAVEIEREEDVVRLRLSHKDNAPLTGFRFGRWLWIANFGLLSALVFWVLAEQQAKLAVLAGDAAMLRQQVSQSVELFDEVERQRQRLNALNQQRLQRPKSVLIVEELSRLLPDEAHLRRIQIAGASIKLQGVSSNAASLVRTLETSSYFSNVRFEASVVRDARSDGERFSIAAQLAAVRPPGNSRS